MKKIIVIIFIAVITFLLLGGPFKYTLFHSFSGEANAIITDVKKIHIVGKRQTRHDEYSYTYKFQVETESYTGKTSYVRPKLELGDKLEIRFSLSNPKTSISKYEVDDAIATTLTTAIIGGIVLLMYKVSSGKRTAGSR